MFLTPVLFFLLNCSIAEGCIKVLRIDGEETDGSEIRAAIAKYGTSAPVGASFRWAINASPHFLQLQVRQKIVIVPS